MSPIPPPTPVTPETHLIPPTQHSPNSALPIIVYRQVLTDTSPSAILSTIEPNGWLKGGQFKASPASKVPHFHSVCHECYGIIRGRSTYLLGKSPVDEDVDGLGRKLGLELRVEKGDVFVLPAGTTHQSLETNGDYEFIGLYPNEPGPDGLRYDMNFGKESPEKTREIGKKCEQVEIPLCDPLYGKDGPLVRIWREAAARAKVTS